ncbi:type II 3-dehydroquinate dehydratase [Parvibacter caecicola]|uniref:3-dehydroquinate dehydratase n=1 Tax=Parvibacter caecicola TaxID=747645 RepID=A0A4T9TD67_9ACTN|nr:type II 3-dehydroquinate dehydratase [Parvibacter caecicola]TJW12274.1 type II 3-dehydroquinate dehydratase [Parvibacter caecicola]
MRKVLLMNGPNLNMLGVRDPAIYGSDTLASIEQMVEEYGRAHGVQVDCFQSNHEGALVDALQAARGNYDGIVYNPGAHTHYSYALHDAVECIDVPVVEIHISDISKREEFRRTSVIAPACIAQVKGLGKEGYLRAFDILLKSWEGAEDGR